MTFTHCFHVDNFVLVWLHSDRISRSRCNAKNSDALPVTVAADDIFDSAAASDKSRARLTAF